MDFYTFILLLISVVGGLVILGLFAWIFGIRPATKKLQKESQQLQLKINQLKNQMKAGSEEDFVLGALKDVSVDEIIDALGIPAPFKGVAKGFAEGILKDPTRLKNLAEKLGFKIPDEKQDGQTGNLL